MLLFGEPPGAARAVGILNCENLAKATAGQDGQIAWAAMLDKVERRDPSFRQ